MYMNIGVPFKHVPTILASTSFPHELIKMIVQVLLTPHAVLTPSLMPHPYHGTPEFFIALCVLCYSPNKLAEDIMQLITERKTGERRVHDRKKELANVMNKVWGTLPCRNASGM